MKKKISDNRDMIELKEKLRDDIEAKRLSIGQTIRRMREIIGMSQADYAKRILKIYPRVLMNIENNKGNPTLRTLRKIAKPFNLDIAFVVPPPRDFKA